ncbi:MAG: aminoglycoside phosphotransferase family protein [Actinomycetota bacterium]|nr:aminoglycoside phosphotransferase family protein [Actinomycetota bacterium]MDQ6948745.1 aminoglycoside phosphotransferase family protein [Actinomycetota bacterium]
MIDPMRRRPSPSTLTWVARSISHDATVVGYRRLTGGITSSVHQLSVDSKGSRRHVVLRRWIGADRDQAAATVEREAEVLVALAGSGIGAPELLAASVDGADTDGCPTLLMTRVAGRPNLTPLDPGAWIGQIAEVLPRIHSLAMDLPPVASWRPLLERGVPPWTRRPHLWREAITLLEGKDPGGDCFIHNDFQHFNLLWRRERLSGIVDWTWSGRGAADRDVGHCRLNLAVLFSVDWAERFRRAYEAEAGRRIDRWWDVHELALYSCGWQRFIPIQVGGRTSVDLGGMHDRVEHLLALTLAKI